VARVVRSGVSAERRKLWREFKWRLSPKSRSAEIGGISGIAEDVKKNSLICLAFSGGFVSKVAPAGSL